MFFLRSSQLRSVVGLRSVQVTEFSGSMWVTSDVGIAAAPVQPKQLRSVLLTISGGNGFGGGGTPNLFERLVW